MKGRVPNNTLKSRNVSDDHQPLPSISRQIFSHRLPVLAERKNIFPSKRDTLTSNNENTMNLFMTKNINYFSNDNRNQQNRFLKEQEFHFEDINNFKAVNLEKVDQEIWKIKCNWEKIEGLQKGRFMRPVRSEGVLKRSRDLPNINFQQRIQNLGLKA